MTTELALQCNPVGAMTLEQGQAAARQLVEAMHDRKLTVRIRGRDYVTVDALAMCGGTLGLTAREVECVEHDGTFVAVVEIVRVSDGVVLGRASAQCGMDESTWKSRPSFARRSMAITRATGKAFRLCVGWVVTLAGYESLSAEELQEDANGESSPAASSSAPAASSKPSRTINVDLSKSAGPSDPATPEQVAEIRRRAESLKLDKSAIIDLFSKHGFRSPKELTVDGAAKIVADLGVMELEKENPF